MTDTYELTLLRDEELRLLHRIERLIAENGQLREALKPFADEAYRRRPWLGELHRTILNYNIGGSKLTYNDLLTARTALEQEPKP